MTPLEEGFVAAHEMYVGLKDAGFSRGEAIELVAKFMVAQVAQAAGEQQS